jgi:hypothetical protein
MEEKLRKKALNNIGILPTVIDETLLAIRNNPIWLQLFCRGDIEKPAAVVFQH